MAKAGRRLTDRQIEARRQKVAELYLKGYDQYYIADKVKVTQQQVSQDIKKLVKRWQESQLESIAEKQAKELEKIDKVETEAWAAWTRSLKPINKTISKNGFNVKGPVEMTEQETQELTGDPRFLATIQKCIDQRCKILGIDAPIKVEHKGEITVKEITGMQIFDTGAPELDEKGRPILFNPN